MESLLSRIPYGTFSNYSPRGSAEISQKSRKICGSIKAGRVGTIESALRHLKKPAAAPLEPFLNSRATLVPVPRSAPLVAGSLWPSEVIANILKSGGLGSEVLPCIERVTAVPKSSSSPASERPLVGAHYESLSVNRELIRPEQITMVDDVLTMGRTMFACALRLHEVFPDAEIRAFAMIRTQGLIDDIENIVDPDTGTITYYEKSGKTHRDP